MTGHFEDSEASMRARASYGDAALVKIASGDDLDALAARYSFALAPRADGEPDDTFRTRLALAIALDDLSTVRAVAAVRIESLEAIVGEFRRLLDVDAKRSTPRMALLGLINDLAKARETGAALVGLVAELRAENAAMREEIADARPRAFAGEPVIAAGALAFTTKLGHRVEIDALGEVRVWCAAPSAPPPYGALPDPATSTVQLAPSAFLDSWAAANLKPEALVGPCIAGSRAYGIAVGDPLAARGLAGNHADRAIVDDPFGPEPDAWVSFMREAIETQERAGPSSVGTGIGLASVAKREGCEDALAGATDATSFVQRALARAIAADKPLDAYGRR